MNKLHNHYWRFTELPIPSPTKEELLETIVKSGNAGYWLKEEEILFANNLQKEEKIKLCCDGLGATIL